MTTNSSVNFEMSGVAKRIVAHSDLDPGDEVVVVADSATVLIASSIATAAHMEGNHTSLTIIPKTQYHGSEPPDSLVASMVSADVVYAVTTHSFTHTEGYRRATGNGTRISTLRGVTEDMFVDGGVNTDYEALDRRTTAVCDALTEAKEAHVTSDAGTDIVVDIAGKDALVLGVNRHDLNDNTGSYPPGESPIQPVEGRSNGTIVVDQSMDNIGQLDEPITLTVEEGTVTRIEGGVEADRLRRIVDEAGPSARNIAEFAIGTNPDARLAGHVAEDKKRLGTVHFAVGDNRTLGGSVRSDIHLDGVVLSPTVRLDGRMILDRGTLRLE